MAVNKPLKKMIAECTEQHYDENYKQWEERKYSVGDCRIMLTHWVGQAWKQFYEEHSDTVQKTFCQLGLSLPVDGSQDQDIHIRNLSGIEVGDWHLPEGAEDQVLPERAEDQILAEEAEDREEPEQQ